MTTKSEPEILLAKHLREIGLSWTTEVRFHPERRWRFDFLLYRDNGKKLESLRIAVEIEGGIFTQGRHTRGKGYQADLDKYNHATMMGYRVLRFSTKDVLTGRARDFLKLHLEREK